MQIGHLTSVGSSLTTFAGWRYAPAAATGVRLLMKLLLPLFVLWFSLTATAQDIEIPCGDSPSEAVLVVPEPAGRYLHVVCTIYGHVLNPTEGWFWTTPGAFSPQFYPSQMVRQNPDEIGNDIYFESIVVNSLDGDAAKEKWDEIFAGMFDESEDSPPDRALEIVANSNMERAHTIYIFPNKFGYSCSATCRKENVFLMISEKGSGETISW